MPGAGPEAVDSAAREAAGLIASMPFPTRAAMNAAAFVLAARAGLAEGAALEQLQPERRDAWMDRWARAQAPPLRQLGAGVRSIALAAFYSQEPGR